MWATASPTLSLQLFLQSLHVEVCYPQGYRKTLYKKRFDVFATQLRHLEFEAFDLHRDKEGVFSLDWRGTDTPLHMSFDCAVVFGQASAAKNLQLPATTKTLVFAGLPQTCSTLIVQAPSITNHGQLVSSPNFRVDPSKPIFSAYASNKLPGNLVAGA